MSPSKLNFVFCNNCLPCQTLRFKESEENAENETCEFKVNLELDWVNFIFEIFVSQLFCLMVIPDHAIVIISDHNSKH